MDDLFHWLGVAIGALQEAEAKFAVVGGLAVSVHVQPRTTHDVDLAIATRDDAGAEMVCAHLLRCGFRVAREFDQTRHQRMATMRFVPPGVHFSDDDDNPLLVDLIFASCGIETEVVRTAKQMRIAPGLTAPVAQLPHLIAMKTLSACERRPKDLADLQALLVAATDAQIAVAHQLVQLIVERDYHNDRDLAAELDGHVQRWRTLA
jgi:predicted nucleotidyltransferase